MYSHLVPVKVCIKCRTHKRMQLDGLTFYQDRFKCLDAKSVQGRGAVEHHRMFLDHLFQYIPDLGIHLVYQFLGILDVLADALGHQFFHHKRLKQLYGHFLGQAALVNLQFRSHHDNGTAGVVHALAQQVLAEAP